ncbi:hypothetical protein N9157_02645 [Saprospiraceae bacterium]|nr:hypothetical protein [Saprospiraceae bacterium]
MTFKDKLLENLKFRATNEKDDPCWDSHKQVGMKKKGGKEVPNCVPKEEVEVVQELTAAEKKLVNTMYDKKGNLTPIGKKVMNHGKKQGDKGFVESVELDENKNLIKDYEKYMSQGGKKDHNAIDYLMSMPKYKRMSKDQMAKTIGDAKRKGIFREEVELDEMTSAQKKKFDKLYKQMLNGPEHRKIMSKAVNKVKGDDQFHALVKKTAMESALSEAMLRQVSEAKKAPYEIYHKDFSGAMQHAYASAKKNYGITVKPSEIDDKVASGPRKPGNGKTNSYRLKGDKGAIQVQVYNMGSKYELNMYKESLDENLKLINRIKNSGVVKTGSMSKDTPAKKKAEAERRKEYNAYQKSKR